jgi:alpha-D-xyloside xylohydrolase
MRGLFHDFPADPRAWEVTDQFLFGPDLLIAPVAELGARERKVYLPDRGRWIDVASGQVHDGGQEMTVPASLETIPVFVRDGADPADGALEALRGRLSPSSAPA